jgi:hypothetical protein
VGGSAVSLANSAGASSADMTEPGGIDARSGAPNDLSGNTDRAPAELLRDQAGRADRGAAAPGDRGGVMTGTVPGDRSGSGLGGGTAPGGPLDLGAAPGQPHRPSGT